MAFAVIEDAEDKDRRLFLHAKNNLAGPPQGFAFRLQQTTVGELGIVASRVVLEPSPVSITANEALAAEAGPGTEKGAPREEAKDFLRQMLAEGPVDVDAVNTQAKALGITERTLKRARHDLGLRRPRAILRVAGSQGGNQTPKGAT